MVFYSENELKSLKEKLESEVLFLIVSATDIETQTVIREMEPLRSEKEIIKVAPDRNTYYIGRLGRYPVIHVKTTDQGTADRDASIMTVNAALNYWNISAIIMIGIAFGCYPDKQHVGDVLVSSSLRNYEDVKIGKRDIEDRSSNPKSGIILLNRFKNLQNWEHSSSYGPAQVLFGEVLSGEKLVDNKDFREQLKARYPMAIGGEMEGYGVYLAAENHGISEWIIVKSICDFAENKDNRKKEKQEIAAYSACSYVKSVLSEPVFDFLKKKTEINITGQFIDNRFLDRKKLPEEKKNSLLRAYMKVNSKFDIISQIVANDLDTFDSHQQKLAQEVLTNENYSCYIIDGNGGEGKTTFAFRLAAGLGIKGFTVFFMDLLHQDHVLTSNDIEMLIRMMDEENSSNHRKSFLFIDNPCSNLTVLEWIHDKAAYQESSVNTILIERANRLRMLFNSNSNNFPEWEEGAFCIRLRNTACKRDDMAQNKNELWINRSFAMRRSIIHKMMDTISGIDRNIIRFVFKKYLYEKMQDKNMTIVEAMFYLKIKYNEIVKERNLPISKRINMDWDEWDSLIHRYGMPSYFSYGYIAALYLFYFEFPTNIIIQERPDFQSVINTLNYNQNVEPLIYNKLQGRIFPKHEAVTEMYFRFCNIDDITHFLIKHYKRFSLASQKAFILRIMRKQYIIENAIGNLHVDFKKVFEYINTDSVINTMPAQIALIRFWISYQGDESDIPRIKELTLKYSDNEEVWKQYIELCVKFNNTDECENGLKSLLSLQKTDYWTLRFVAETYLKMSNIEKSVKYYYAASKKSSNRLKDYRRIEKILVDSETICGLSKVRQRIIEMDNGNFTNYTKLDKALKAEGEMDKRFLNYEFAQRYHPNNPWGYEKAIELALYNGFYGKAMRNTRYYFARFHRINTQAKINTLRYWVMLCWSGDEQRKAIRQTVLNHRDYIDHLWNKEKNESIRRWVFLLCFETGLEQIIFSTNTNQIIANDDLLMILSMIDSNPVDDTDIGGNLNIFWPIKFFSTLFSECKKFLRNNPRFMSSFFHFTYLIFDRLRNACNQNPDLEKTLYLDMKSQMLKWTQYIKELFLYKLERGFDDLLSCVLKYEIILFYAPFHWYEQYFASQDDNEEKLKQILNEKLKVYFNIVAIYSFSAKTLLEIGKTKEAKKANQLLSEIVNRYPKTINFIELYIRSFIALGNRDGVFQWYFYLVNLPNCKISNKLFMDIVNYFISLNDWDKTEKILQTSGDDLSSREKIKIFEMQIYYKKGDLGAAEKIALELFEHNKPIIQTVMILYHIYQIHGNSSKAEEMAYYGVAHFPHSVKASLILADYLRNVKKKEEALNICWSKMDKYNSDLLKMGKDLCCECQQYKKAIFFYYRYCKCMKTNKKLKRLTYDDIVEGLYKQGKTGVLRRFLINLRRHYGYEKTIREYLSKINNTNSKQSSSHKVLFD